MVWHLVNAVWNVDKLYIIQQYADIMDHIVWQRCGTAADVVQQILWWPVSDSLLQIHTILLFTTPHFFPQFMTTPHLKPHHTSLSWRQRSVVWKEVWCELGKGCHLRATVKLLQFIHKFTHKHVTVWLCTCYRSSKHTTTTLCMKEQSMQHLVHGQLFDTTQQQQILCTWENLQLFAQILTTTQCLHGRNMRNLN